MLNVRFDQVRTVLCLGAHSDDIEIGCGGTLLKLLTSPSPVHVHWVVFGAGGQRSKEAARSAELFLENASSSKVIIQGFRDSYFPYIGGQVKEFMEQVRDEVEPDLIFTHRRDDLHQDHRLLSELTWCAFRNHLILEYEIPKYDGDLGRPNLYVPLSEDLCCHKVRALMEVFCTQHAKQWFSEDTYWALLRLRGIECNSPTKFAEAFHGHKLVF